MKALITTLPNGRPQHDDFEKTLQILNSMRCEKPFTVFDKVKNQIIERTLDFAPSITNQARLSPLSINETSIKTNAFLAELYMYIFRIRYANAFPLRQRAKGGERIRNEMEKTEMVCEQILDVIMSIDKIVDKNYRI